MSELTRCNYCNVKRLKIDAKKCGMKVTKKLAKYALGGYDFFVHPKEIMIDPQNPVDRNQYFRMWCMEISSSCEC